MYQTNWFALSAQALNAAKPYVFDFWIAGARYQFPAFADRMPGSHIEWTATLECVPVRCLAVFDVNWQDSRICEPVSPSRNLTDSKMNAVSGRS